MTPGTPEPDVVVSDPLVGRFLDPAALPAGTVFVDVSGSADDTVAAAISRARAVVAARIPAATLATAGRLGFIQVPGIGVDGIPFDDLPPGVLVANTAHHARSIAEYAVMGMILMGRRLFAADRFLRRGVWNAPHLLHEPGAFVASTLEGQTVLVVGFGNIGREVARVASAFDMRVLAIRKRPGSGSPAPGVEEVGDLSALDRMLAEADHVVIAVPLTPETKSLVGPDQFDLMKPTATLINVSRGPVVDPASLFDALSRGVIGAAAIDVWYHYPSDKSPVRPADPPFETLDNVLMTPHVSGVTVDTFGARAAEIADNLRRFFEGSMPRNLVWPRQPAE